MGIKGGLVTGKAQGRQCRRGRSADNRLQKAICIRVGKELDPMKTEEKPAGRRTVR